MKVTAKNIYRGTTIEIVGNANDMIANAILSGICWFEKIDCDEVYYGSDFDFTIDDIDKMEKEILLLANIGAENDISTVHITVYNNNIAVKELLFTNVIKS